MSDAGGVSPRRLREEVALALWNHEAIRVRVERPFELASGNRSPIYVNCRVMISDPEFMRLYTRAAAAILAASDVHPDAVAGGETAGIPYAAYLARELDKPMLYVRKKAKGHGVANRVEGRLEPGWNVLLVEDLITDGGSKLGFIEALRAAGGEVVEALVLFDREQGGTDLLDSQGVRLHSVADRQTALVVGEARGELSADARREVESYFADPAGWHRERDLPYHQAQD